MTLVTVTDTLGNEAPLQITGGQTVSTLCQVGSLSFSAYDTADNIGFNMLTARSVITIPNGQKYRIQSRSGSENGDTKQLSISCLHVLQDLNDHYVSGTIEKTQSLKACMDFILKGTKFTYTIHDTIANYAFSDGFGNGLALDLFLNTLMPDFGFEFKIDNYHIDIYKNIGQKDAFAIINHEDVMNITDNADYTTIKTHIKGTGKVPGEGETGTAVTAEYTSPASSVYGVLDAEPISDERFTIEATLKEYLKKSLQDYPLIQYTSSWNQFEQMTKADSFNKIEVGNWGYLKDRYDIDVNIRISSITEYLDEKDGYSSLTFGNLMQNFTQISVNLRNNRKEQNKIGSQLKQLQNDVQNVYGMGVITEKVGDSVVGLD